MDNSTGSNNGNSSSNSGGGGGGGGGLDSGTTLSIVALIISIIALLGSIMQVLQQYYSSATGYANCDEKVMGEWHRSKRRIFRTYELRFEVQFEAPVIFVCRPNNKAGPVKGQPICILDGTPASLDNSRTRLPKEEEHRQSALSTKDQVHTADNERATWVTLLSELQNMESESRNWQRRKFGVDDKPPRDGTPSSSVKVPADFSEHTLAVALQSKKRSWDTMPGNVKKPYATTTMCHMVEIAAMLGIYWKEFDRSRNRYRAEGNGYVLTGDYVTDLGIMFSFQICGKSKFSENRILPVDEVKELCFGYASTIFLEEKEKDIGRRQWQNEEELSRLGKLKLATPHEIAETLAIAGCNTNTVNYFHNDKKKVSHLFPVAFELLGMLGKTVQIPNSAFRMLPNPTCYHWDRRTFSMRKLLTVYWQCLNNEDITRQTEHTRRLLGWVKPLCKELDAGDFSPKVIDLLHQTLDNCDAYFNTDDETREKVVLVVREHFQVVLKMINADGDESLAVNGSAATVRGSISGEPGAPGRKASVSSPVSPTTGAGTQHSQAGETERPPSFDVLNAASPEEKLAQFMDIYFSVVLPNVVQQFKSLKQRNTTFRNLFAGNGHGHGHGRPPNLSAGSGFSLWASRSPSPSPSPSPITASPAAEPEVAASTGVRAGGSGGAASATRRRGAPMPPQVQIQTADDDDGEDGDRPGELLRRDTSPPEEQVVSNLWYTLVLRMLCWLLLHDFHKKDVQIPKSELVGSRLPVYIA